MVAHHQQLKKKSFKSLNKGKIMNVGANVFQNAPAVSERTFLHLWTKGSLHCSSPVPLPADRSECADKAESCRRNGSINTENKGFALPILIQSTCETFFGVQTYNQEEKHMSICQKCFRHFLSASEQIKHGPIYWIYFKSQLWMYILYDRVKTN